MIECWYPSELNEIENRFFNDFLRSNFAWKLEILLDSWPGSEVNWDYWNSKRFWTIFERNWWLNAVEKGKRSTKSLQRHVSLLFIKFKNYFTRGVLWKASLSNYESVSYELLPIFVLKTWPFSIGVTSWQQKSLINPQRQKTPSKNRSTTWHYIQTQQIEQLDPFQSTSFPNGHQNTKKHFWNSNLNWYKSYNYEKLRKPNNTKSQKSIS